MVRVTKSGGIVAVRDVDYASMVWYPESDDMALWLDLYRQLARANHAEPDAGRLVNEKSRGDLTRRGRCSCCELRST